MTHAHVQGVADKKVNREKEREKVWGNREVEEREEREEAKERKKGAKVSPNGFLVF